MSKKNFQGICKMCKVQVQEPILSITINTLNKLIDRL